MKTFLINLYFKHNNRYSNQFIILTIQLLLYIGFALFGYSEQVSDGKAYLEILNNIVDNGGIYPDKNVITNNYINNPGALNFYLLFYKLFHNNLRALFLVNVFLILFGNIVILTLFSKLGYSEKSKLAFLLFSTLYISNLGLINTITSDTFAYFFMSLTLLLVFKQLNQNKSYFFYIGFGVLLAVFDYIRSVGLVVMIAVLLIYFILWTFEKNKVRSLNVIFILIFFFSTKIGISKFHKYFTNIEISGSVSTGYNFLMGTGRDSDGTWQGGVFNTGGKGFFNGIHKETAMEKDRRWIQQSLDSIVSSPIFHLKLGIQKLIVTFSYDILGIEKLSYPKVKFFSIKDLLNYGEISTFNLFLIILDNNTRGFSKWDF